MDDDDSLEELQRARPAQADLVARRLEARVREAVLGIPAEPTRLDRFVVLEKLGSGAMGVVYAAFDPKLDRRVALKVVRAEGAAPRERVLAEARALARLSHPNVVAVHDAAEVGDDLYIAMELVPGGNLRSWLAAGAHPISEIVEVLVQAGRGIAAAHAAKLIHGDIKPENILVGDGAVKIADFGLAHADGGHDGHGRAGTPAYMAPELLEGAPPDARSDQYALAASLYEAIAGTRPGRPPAPLAAPARIARAVTRALSPDPAARFESISALLEQIAPRPSRLWIGALAVAALAVLAAVWAFALADRSDDPCGAADHRLATVWTPSIRAALPVYADRAIDDYARTWSAMARATCEATHRGEQSEAMLDLRMSCLDRRLDELDAFVTALARTKERASPAAIPAAFKLSPVEPCADREQLAGVLPPPAEQRDAVAALRRRIARAHGVLQTAEAPAAGKDIEAAVGEARALGYTPLLGEVLLQLGLQHHRAGQYDRAVQLLKEAASAASLGHDDVTLAEAWLDRAYVLGTDLGRSAEALAYLEAADALAGRGRHATLQRASIRQHTGEILMVADRVSEARASLEQALGMFQEARGPDHPQVADVLRKLAILETAQGDTANARRHAERARSILEAAFGADHLEVTFVLEDLANIRRVEGDLERSLAEHRLVLKRRIAEVGEDDVNTAISRSGLGIVLHALGRDDEARGELERAHAIFERRGAQTVQSIDVLSLLAKVERDPAKKQRRLEDVLARRIATVGANHHTVADTVNDLGLLARDRGDLGEAAAKLERALAIYEKALGPDHQRVSIALSNLGDLAIIQRRFDDAVRWCNRARALDEAALGPDHPDLAYDLTCLGEARLGLGDPRAAVELLERARTLRGRDATPAERSQTLFALARALWAAGGDRGRARSLAEEAAPHADPAARREAIQGWLREHPR